MVNSVSQLIGAGLTTIARVAIMLASLSPILLVLVIVAGVPALIAAIRNSRPAYAFDYAMTPEGRERVYVMELLSRTAAKESGCSDATQSAGAASRLPRERMRSSDVPGGAAARLPDRRGCGRGKSGARAGHARRAPGERAIDVSGALTAGLASAAALRAALRNHLRSIGVLIESGMFLDDYHGFWAWGAGGLGR